MPLRQSAQVAILVVSLSAFLMLASLGMSFSAGTVEAPSDSWVWEEEITFPQISIDFEENEWKVAMDDLPLGGEVAGPLLPYESVMVPIPTGFSVTGAQAEFLGIESIGPLDPIAKCSDEIPISGEEGHEPISTNPSSPQRLFPIERVEFMGVQVQHGSSFAMVKIFPSVFDSVTKSLTYARGARLILETVPFDQESGIETGDRVFDEVELDQDPLLDPAEYVIITSSSLEPYFQPLLEWKMERGSYSRDLQNITGDIVTIESITSNPKYWGDPNGHDHTGNDTQTQVRNFIIDCYQTRDTSYVLLAGDVEIIPCRKVRVVHSLTSYIPADVYYAGLDGNWDDDDDGIYGEGGGMGGGTSGDEADLLLEMNVGRATVDSSQEAINFVNKVIGYESASDQSYINSVLLVAEKLDSRPTWGADYKDEIRDETFPEVDPEITVNTLYERDGTFSRDAFISAMNDGVNLINHIGHGDYDSFADLSISSVDSLTNEQYFILFSQACLIGGFDQNVDTIAEELLSSDHGAVALLVNSREGWYSPGDTDGSSQQYDKQFFDAIFQEGIRGLGPALVDAKTDLVPTIYDTGSMRWCFMTLNLLGDPETVVHFVEERTHDATVLDVEADEAFAGEECSIHALIGNFGEVDEFGIPVELEVDGEVVSSTNVDVHLNGTAIANLSWSPSGPGLKVLTVRTNLTLDNWTSNDEFCFQLEVRYKVTGLEEIRDSIRDQDFAFNVESNGTLRIINSTLFINSTYHSPSFRVGGNLEIINSSLHFNIEYDLAILCEEGSQLSIMESNVEALDPVACSMRATFSPNIDNSTFIRLELLMDGVVQPTLCNAAFEGNEVAINISNSSDANIDSIAVSGAETGMIIKNSTGTFRSVDVRNCSTGMSIVESSDLFIEDCSIMDCDQGLNTDRSKNLTLMGNSAIGNAVDISFNGTELSHFEHDLSSNQVSSGGVLFLRGEDDFTLESNSSLGYLAIVSCSNGSISGLDLHGNGEGIVLVDSTSISVENCSFHGNQVGARIMGSSDCSFVGNDFTSNDRQVDCDSATSFNGSYEVGGNFWDSYLGDDICSGPDQNWSGADGIGDIPYHIPGTTCSDNYPLMYSSTSNNSPPEARFDIVSSSPYTGDNVRFLDRSYDLDGTILNRTWDLGDGSVEYGDEVIHTYPENGLFNITLWVMDNNRKWDSFSKLVTVNNRLPFAVFSHSPDFPEVNEAISFTDGSWDSDGQIISWFWEWGDGTNSTARDPMHSYSGKGTFSIELTVWDDDGGTCSNWHSIVVGNEPPVAGFSCSPSDPLTMDEVNFQDRSDDPDGQISEWHWDFGDGDHSSESNPTHSYRQWGSYRVVLEVTDDSGESASFSMIIQVGNRPPEAIFSVSPSTLFSGAQVSFQDQSEDSDGQIVEWQWNFGDGNTSDLRHPVHTFAEPGNFTIYMAVRDDAGAWNETIMEVRVEDGSPRADFEISPDEVYSLMEVSFNDLSLDRNGDIINWSWSFGDGVGSHLPCPNHAYDGPGLYNVTLTVVDDQGFESILTQPLEVHNLAPVSNFTWSASPASPYAIQLNSTSYDPDGDLTSHYWNFGDDQISTETDPFHTFTKEGRFTVSLLVTDKDGNSTLIQKDIWIRVHDLVLANDSILIDGAPVAGEALMISITVMNSGPIDIEEVTLTFLLDGQLENESTFSLLGGMNTTITMRWVPTEGNHTIAFQVEAEVNEISLDNNLVSFEVEVESQQVVEGNDSQEWLPFIAIIILICGAMAVIIGLRLSSR